MLAVEPTAALRAKVAENPGVVFEDVAREHNVAPRDIVDALPDAMRRFAPGDKFKALAGKLCGKAA